MTDTAANAVYLLLISVLVISAFAAHRVPLNTTIRMIAIWLAIFGVAFLLFNMFGHRLSAWQAGRSGTIVAVQQSTAKVEIPMSADGHFWIDAKVNGQTMRFLVDSGATRTGLNMADARRAGIAIDDGPRLPIDTANGTVMAQRSRIDQLDLGGMIIRDVPVVVAENFGDTNVIGMNVLAKMDSWSVSKGTMTLSVKP